MKHFPEYKELVKQMMVARFGQASSPTKILAEMDLTLSVAEKAAAKTLEVLLEQQKKMMKGEAE